MGVPLKKLSFPVLLSFFFVLQEIFPQGSAHLAVTRLAEAFSSAKLPVRSVFRANDPSMKVRLFDPPVPLLF